LNVVVTGWVAPFPAAGFLWHAVSFALGFQALGHKVWFVEDSGDEPWGWDPDAGVEDPECRAGIRFLADEMEALGLGDRWAYRDVPSGRSHGLDEPAVRDLLAGADVLVNVSLTTAMRPEYLDVPHRLAIDTDPVFTQVRVARGDGLLSAVPETHTRLYTFGRPPLPAQRHEWVPTRQPVAADRWPVQEPAPPGGPFTTVTTWKAYDPVAWEGVSYAAKDVSFRPFLDLPRRRPDLPLCVALGAGTEPQHGVRALSANGWRVVNSLDVTRTTEAYRSFIADSVGELGFAKHGYVAARSGWFSERSCCYLASGRPVVAQDTGWTDWLPSGDGLLAFSTPEDAEVAMDEVLADPDRHGRAARKLVEEHFDAARVCADLLEAL
jgi:hypothetical protein